MALLNLIEKLYSLLEHAEHGQTIPLNIAMFTLNTIPFYVFLANGHLFKCASCNKECHSGTYKY